MKFYDCASAPSPRRVRIFIAEKGIELPTQQVDLSSQEQLSDEFRRINPYCSVPVLELDDGAVITEVLAICQYLEEFKPQPPLFGRDMKERALVTMWNTRIEQNGLAAVAESFRNRAKGFRGRALVGPLDVEQIPALVPRGRIRAESFLQELNTHLANNEFVVSDYFSIADISALITVDFAAWIKLPIPKEATHLERWHQSVSSRPSAAA